MLNILGLLLFIALVVLFAWLTRRAWKARNIVLRWGGTILAGLLTLVLAFVTILIGRGLYKANMPRHFPVPDITLSGTPEQVARGEHLALTVCAACHSANNDLPLTGGHNLSDDSGLPLGDIYPPNLTPAGEIASWSDGELLRAIRQGTHQNGRPLAGMPIQRLQNLSDADAQAVIAFLRSQPAVVNETPPTSPSLLAAFFLGVGLFNIDAQPITQPIIAPVKAATFEYGEYIVSYTDCRDCHGEDLSGGKPPAPPGPNLRVVQGWTQEQFITTLRTGVDPSGHQLEPIMPWQTYGKMDDVELAAVYLYLKALPPVKE